MNLLIIAEVLVHFAGLSVVSNQLPQDPGVKIIMPSLHYTPARLDAPPVASHAAHASEYLLVGLPAPQGRRAPAGMSAPLLQPRDFYHVEDHQAMLIFKTEGAASTNWPILPLPNDPGYSYVVLNGERVEFRTNVVNPAPDITNIPLPHLQKTCCNAMSDKELQPSFTKPYPGAAAVFDISQGVMSACNARVAENLGRRDTEISYQNGNGYFFMIGRTATTTRQLRIATKAGENYQIIASNLPATYLSGSRITPEVAAINGRPHYYAYYDMGKVKLPPNGKSPCTTSMVDCLANEAIQPSTGCKATMRISFVGEMVKPLKPVVANYPMASNFECSNSQWP